jgi:hypothetical protein
LSNRDRFAGDRPTSRFGGDIPEILNVRLREISPGEIRKASWQKLNLHKFNSEDLGTAATEIEHLLIDQAHWLDAVEKQLAEMQSFAKKRDGQNMWDEFERLLYQCN